MRVLTLSIINVRVPSRQKKLTWSLPNVQLSEAAARLVDEHRLALLPLAKVLRTRTHGMVLSERGIRVWACARVAEAHLVGRGIASAAEAGEHLDPRAGGAVVECGDLRLVARAAD